MPATGPALDPFAARCGANLAAKHGVTALRELGTLVAMRGYPDREWGADAMLYNLWSDCRYAARSLTRSPGFAVAAIVTIALGVGVNTGIFTILNGVLFRDLPAPDAHELVSIAQTVEGGDFAAARAGVGTFTISDYRAYSERAQTLAGVLAHSPARDDARRRRAAEESTGAIVSCNYFTVMRTPPALGRALNAQDCEPGAAPVVVLGHGIWTTSFAADAAIVGRTGRARRQSLYGRRRRGRRHLRRLAVRDGLLRAAQRRAVAMGLGSRGTRTNGTAGST